MSSPASIVVAHASVGSGHRLAAEAVARELTSLVGDAISVELFDALDGCPTWPAALADSRMTASPLGRWMVATLTPLAALACRRFAATLVSLQPAAVISTHPLPTAIAAHLVTHDRIRSVVVSAPTDFDVAGATPRHGVDLYCAADDACAEILAQRGVAGQSIATTGIPVRPQFTVEYDTAAARSHFGLPAERRVLLAIAGSSAPETYTHLKDALAVSLPALASLPDAAVAIVAGRDTAFAAEIRSRSLGFGTTNVHVFDYVEHMAPLIACADLVLAKPAGLVCAECVDSGAPLVLVGPAEGHERANARTLMSAGVAVFAEDPSTLAEYTRKALSAPKKLARMREATATLSRPFAASDIARRTLMLSNLLPDQAPESVS